MAKTLVQLIAEMPKAVTPVTPHKTHDVTEKTQGNQSGYTSYTSYTTKQREPSANYDEEERLAIQEESKLPPDRGWDDVPGFEGLPEITPAQHGAILDRLRGAQS